MIHINYVTSSEFKRQEAKLLLETNRTSGQPWSELVEFEFREHSVQEALLVKLDELVIAEATSAYKELRIPCIVEHAGLEFSGHETSGYPGGLTKAMWNALGGNFVEETGSANRAATAVAVVAYCDGMDVHVFEGKTPGRIAEQPRGDREFYWDTIFVPDADPKQRTYAEIVAAEGLKHKVAELSQSAIALRSFLEYRVSFGLPHLWRL